MFNKESCRSCGSILSPVLKCKLCKEYVSWTCDYCHQVEDVSHRHEKIHRSPGDKYLDVKDKLITA